ncbi:MAG: HAMP domain-containing protein [Desulfobacterales bacterium]|nr:HAMP domain-containing protein [Desulfobacterales bacterium]
MKNIGIRFRLLIAVSTLICATTFTLGYIGISMTHRFVLTRFEERISFLAKYLALNTELGILIADRSMLRRLASNLLSEKDVAAVAIFDSQGIELTNVSKGVSGPSSIVKAPVLVKRSQEETKAFRWDVGPWPDQELIGEVRVTYSTEGIDQLLTTIGTRFFWISAGLACLAGMVFYFFSRSLVAPVTQLARAARQVAQGDLDFRARPGTLPETRDLATAFNAMLDSLVRSRKALDEANEEMMRQNTLAELGEFSLMIAHEVKNPLSIIKSSLDVLKKDMALSSNETMVFYIEDEIRRLNLLIEDFLVFARPARPSFRSVDLKALLKEIVTRFELQKAGSSMEIYLDVPPEPCYGKVDPDLITRAIGNIIKNAFEANGDRGLMRITGYCRDAAFLVDIEDEGEGIDPEDMDKIFEPFFTTRAKGTGLGLAYTSQVIRNHGGVIMAKNRAQRGAIFRIKLPMNPESEIKGPGARDI